VKINHVIQKVKWAHMRTENTWHGDSPNPVCFHFKEGNWAKNVV